MGTLYSGWAMTDVVIDCREKAADLLERGYVTDKTLEELKDV